MKIRLLERELEKSGYQLLPKRGKGNHRLYFNRFAVAISSWRLTWLDMARKPRHPPRAISS